MDRFLRMPTNVMINFKLFVSFILLGAICLAGCNTQADNSSEVDNPPDVTSDREPISATQQFGAGMNGMMSPAGASPSPRELDPVASPKEVLSNQSMQGGGVVGSTPQAPTPEPEPPKRELRSDLSPAELVRFLSESDKYMQAIFTGRAGITDQRRAIAEMNQTAQLKLKAARRLKDHPDSTDAQRIEGARGEVQSLSHLASQGDLSSAKELRAIAEQAVDSTDNQLAVDSLLVLIGFAMEDLQSGKSDAPQVIQQQVQQLAKSTDESNVPAMMMMGHVRELLTKYGHETQAAFVRQLIIDKYADSADPDIARLAAQVAGNVRFDQVESLRAQLLKGESVSTENWVSAANALVDEAPDLVTVQYLAGAALELEGIGNAEKTQATYDVMQKRFADAANATGREVELAVKAFEARKAVIGSEFTQQIGALDGQPLDLHDYRGKIVLMPFWSSAFPESLQVVSILEELKRDHEEDISIIGMNLDPVGPRLDQFLAATKLSFRSLHAISSPSDGVGNVVAAKFGMVSMPFVAILDQNGKVAGIDFTGRNLKPTIQRLLSGN